MSHPVDLDFSSTTSAVSDTSTMAFTSNRSQVNIDLQQERIRF